MVLPIVGLEDLIPLFVFTGSILAVWAVLSMVALRNRRVRQRLDRITQLGPLMMMKRKKDAKAARDERFLALVETFKALAAPLTPETELEQNQLKVQLANAGFHRESAVAVYLGLRVAMLLGSLLLSAAIILPLSGFTLRALNGVILLTGVGFYLPCVVLRYLRGKRQKTVSMQLPDVLDLLVVCVESGLGLDAAIRKVRDEMRRYARVICEELSLAIFQLQMGRPRREVLSDLGVRTGVDEVRSLAALLIQADRLGSSVALSLRVLSDSIRTRRKQRAEEKAARTAVLILFPLVLFIFPGIFVVLAGPAALSNGLWPMAGDW